MPVSTSRILDMMDDVIYSERYADISFTCSYPMDTDSKDDHKITIMIVRYSEPFRHKHDFFRIYPGDEQYDVIFNVLEPYILIRIFRMLTSLIMVMCRRSVYGIFVMMMFRLLHRT